MEAAFCMLSEFKHIRALDSTEVAKHVCKQYSFRNIFLEIFFACAFPTLVNLVDEVPVEVAGLLRVGHLAALVADELAGVEVVAAQVVAQVGEVAEPGVAGDAERLVPRRRLHVLRDLLELGVDEGALAAAVQCLGLLHLWLLTFPAHLFSYFHGHFEGFKIYKRKVQVKILLPGY